MLPVHFLDSDDSTTPTELGLDDEVTERDEPERVVRCAACEHELTRAKHRFAKDGRPDHVFTNPHGYTFRIATWREAPGCGAAGPESDEWAWFPGWTWQTALCRGCLTHIGWFFHRGADGFVALILAKIQE